MVNINDELFEDLLEYLQRGESVTKYAGARPCCEECGYYQEKGHSDKCKLGKLIKRLEDSLK